MQVSLALIAVQILFGINYAVSKYILAYLPPLVWASSRIFVAAVAMLAYAKWVWKKPSPFQNLRALLPLIPFALFGMIINQSAFLMGLRFTTAGNSAILNTMIPLFTVGVVALMGKEKFHRGKVFGFTMALIGVLIIQKVENLSFHGDEVIGNFLTLLNCLSYAVFLGIGKNFLENTDRVWATAWLFVFGAIGIGSLSIPAWQDFDFQKFSSQTSPFLFMAMAFSIIGGTLLTYFLNLWALARVKSSEVALYIYLQPFIAVLVAWLWLGEIPTLRTGIASLFIFVGIWQAMRK